jgi:predicted DCC family thiol-disulfide oxidoreductase YuxK
MRLPDFLIIGAAKSGTTTLFRYLGKHPQVFVPKEPRDKEPNFFGMDEKYARGLSYYASLFDGTQPHQICGEASTDYAKWPRFPESAARIAQTLPHVKLIYIMRNPIDRAYSYYVHINRNQPVEESFEDYICRTTEALDASNYMLQIQQYLLYFPKEQFLFLLMEDLIQHPAATLAQVCRFIGIDDTIDCTTEVVTANQGKKYFDDTIRGKITAPLKSIPLVAATATMLPQRWRDQAYSFLQKTPYAKGVKDRYAPQPMRSETRQMLIEKFMPLNQTLATFLDRDLSHWNQ